MIVEAQVPPVKIVSLIDTIHLKEVTITSAIPLNNKQIEKFYKTNYYSTIDNLTSHLEGISLIKRGSYAMEPQLNGFSGGQLNVTIDGMKMFGACTDKMDPITSYIEPVNLKSITLEHGTSGSLHGSNVGGSIDLSLREPENEGTKPFYTSISFGYESVARSRNILFSTGYSKNKWEWGLNGVYRKNDIYTAGNGRKIPFSQFQKSNIHTVLKFLPDSGSYFKTDILYDLATDIGYPALPMDVSKARASIFALEYNSIKEVYEFTSKVYYNSVYHVMDDSKRDSLFFIEDKVNNTRDSVIMRMEMPGWSNTFGIFAQLSFRLNNRNKLIIKADNYINSSLAEMTMHMHFLGKPEDPPMYLQTWPEIRRSVTGIFIQNTTLFSSKSSLTVNGRIDYDSDKLMSDLAAEQFSVLNYNLAGKNVRYSGAVNLLFRYKIISPLVLTIQSGIAERVPTISELYGFYLYNAYDGYDYIGNPGLKTEKSLSSRLALTWYNKDLKINLSQSLNWLKDYIMGVTNVDIPPMNFYTNGLRVYSNLPGAVLRSTDIQIMYSPVESFSFFLLTKYTYGKLNTGEPMPLISPLKNILSASYEYRKWTFQVDNETALRQTRINSGYGEAISPAYSIFNLKAGYHLMFAGAMMDFSIGVTNLFDKNYYEHLDWGHIPRPGRSINFFLRLKY